MMRTNVNTNIPGRETMAASAQTSKTKIADDGLHYNSKPAGSMFAKPGQGGYSNKTMSCFFCGVHRTLDELTTRKILGRNSKVCSVDCRKKG
jgi:hypothetical protein